MIKKKQIESLIKFIKKKMLNLYIKNNNKKKIIQCVVFRQTYSIKFIKRKTKKEHKIFKHRNGVCINVCFVASV